MLRKCGHPIFQYHHIVPYTEEDPHYRLQDMMVLCPNCHDEPTQGVMKESQQRELKADPYNLRHGCASGQLAVEHREAKIIFGDSVAMVAQGSLLEIDGESLLGLRLGPSGDLRLSVALYDEEDALLAQVVENVWEAVDPFPWDLDFGYRHLVIREGEHRARPRPPRRPAATQGSAVAPGAEAQTR